MTLDHDEAEQDIENMDSDSDDTPSGCYLRRMEPVIDTSRVDEIPAKEPKFNAVPLKSALKKKTSGSDTPTNATPTQEHAPHTPHAHARSHLTFNHTGSLKLVHYIVIYHTLIHRILFLYSYQIDN